MKNKNLYPFHVIAKPVGPICNFACEYCFYLKKKDSLFPEVENFTMSDATLECFIASYITQQPVEVETINFSWQGGEPTLLGIDYFEKVVALQKKHNIENKRITNGFQTNGALLNDAWGDFLHKNKFLVGISIDGPEKLHNKFRKFKDGTGSFKTVMHGLKILQRHNVEFNILTVVQSDNSNHPDLVYDFLKSLGAKHLQFIPIVESGYNTDSKVSQRSVDSEKWGDFLNRIFDLWLQNDIGEIFIQHFESLLEMTLGYPSSSCTHCQTCGRAVIIEHNGNVYSCDHFAFTENYLGNINISSFSSIMNSSKQIKFGLDKVDNLTAQCQECEYLKLCNGGCPAHRINLAQNEQRNSNYLCKGYYKFFEHTEKYLRALSYCICNNISPKEYREFISQ